MEYEMGSKVYLVIAQKKDAKVDDQLDRYMAFVTNVKFDDPREMVDVIPEEYRWG